MKILITGGSGFIGSNLVKSLLSNPKVSLVRVLDDLSTGNIENITPFMGDPRFEFIEGDIRNIETVKNAVNGVDAISHQAALGSVPRSISSPVNSHDVNVNGFINVLEAARIYGVKRVVYASSSSVYGDLKESPKIEHKVGKVLSPYAATKMSNELYAEAYARCYNMTICGFRYFNVFGANQDPNGPYAAVIPLFIKAALQNQPPTINGDGTITRDFTPVQNVVQINTLGLFEELNAGEHYVFNVACGKTTTLNEIWNLICSITNCNSKPIYGPNRPGDILFSLADINHARNTLGYNPTLELESALSTTIDWYRQNLNTGEN